MPILQNTFRQILAAFCFFTRLPFWRIAHVEKRYYEQVISWWPLVGWLTGGIMAIVYMAASACQLPLGVCIVLAVVSRVLITGALHEDGFADFCDGFGGGTQRQRILEIMKDSHIGTYGVLGLVLYYLLLWNILTDVFSHDLSPLLFVAADAACKFFSSTIIYFLPYARSEAEAKNKLIYVRPSATVLLISFVFGLLPISLLMIEKPQLAFCLIVPTLCCLLLFTWMHRRIQGYTGDCCGATFIITELTFYLSLCLILSQNYIH